VAEHESGEQIAEVIGIGGLTGACRGPLGPDGIPDDVPCLFLVPPPLWRLQEAQPVPVLPASPDKKSVERQDQGHGAHGGGDDQRGTHVRQLPSLNKMQRAYEADRRRGSKQRKPGRQERLHSRSGRTPRDPMAQQVRHDDQEDQDQEVPAERGPVSPSAGPADIEEAQITVGDQE